MHAGFAADLLNFEISHPGMDGRGGSPGGAVAVAADALPLLRLPLAPGQGGDLMALLHQRRRQMAKLARKILVNEEQAHGAICAGWTRCICPESFAACLISGASMFLASSLAM